MAVPGAQIMLHGEERKQLTHDYDFLFFLSLAIWPDKGHRGALKKEERHSREINFVEFFLEGGAGLHQMVEKEHNLRQENILCP